MRILFRIPAALLLAFVGACTSGGGGEIPRYAPPSDLAPSSAATLTVGHLDTGFLYFGNTRISINAVDGKVPPPGPQQRLILAPGSHTVIVGAFRDPVLARGCIVFNFEAGHNYVAQTTAPEIDKTTMWLEDEGSHEVVSQKVSAQTGRDPVMWGPGLKALFLSPVTASCPPAS